MSSISANYSVRPLDPGQVDQTNETNNAKGKSEANLTISLTINNPTDVGAPIRIELQYPLIGIEDVPMNELMQALENLDLSQFEGLTLARTVMQVNQAVINIAEAFEGVTQEFFDANRQQIADMFGQVENLANQAANSLYNVIANSNYPDFSQFLKSMLEVALELRKSAADARMSAIKGEFHNTLAQADLMKEAAAERYEKAMADIKAKEAEAWAQLAGAIVSIGISAVGARVGGFDGMQAVSGLANSSSQIGSAIGGLISASFMRTAAEHEKNAALLDAQVKELEATNKMYQEASNIASELKDIAKQLMDMVLKLYQDFMSSQNQIVQRANI